MRTVQQQIKSAINRKLIRPLDDGIKYNVNKLNICNQINYRETINLLIQSTNTLSTVEMLLNANRLVDANSLLRSSFEYMLVGMMLQFDDNVFSEFINLSIDDENARDSTKIYRLINRFKTHLNEICLDLFDGFNKKEKGDILTNLYNKLCKFTHSSVIVSSFVEIKNSDDKEMLKMLNYESFYFVKILLFHCLKYFTKDEKHYIYPQNITVSLLFYHSVISARLKDSENMFEKYNKFLYTDLNKKYFDKDIKYIKQSEIELLKENNNEINNKLMEMLRDFLS